MLNSSVHCTLATPIKAERTFSSCTAKLTLSTCFVLWYVGLSNVETAWHFLWSMEAGDKPVIQRYLLDFCSQRPWRVQYSKSVRVFIARSGSMADMAFLQNLWLLLVNVRNYHWNQFYPSFPGLFCQLNSQTALLSHYHYSQSTLWKRQYPCGPVL